MVNLTVKQIIWPWGVLLLIVAGAVVASFLIGEHFPRPTPTPTPATEPISLPDTIVSGAGAVKITAKTQGTKVHWVLPKGLVGQVLNATSILVWPDPYTKSTWTVQAFATVGSDLVGAQCQVTFGDAPPGPTPGPTPGPVPIPGQGLRVLFVYDPAATNSMSPGQGSVMFGKQVKDYLDAKCAKANGKAEWRVYPKGQDVSGESDLWQKAFARPQASLPWMVVSNGTSGYEGPVPGSVQEAMTLLQKYGG